MPENNSDPVHVHLTFNVSLETVFDAWTDPEVINKWLFVGPTSQIVHAELELEVGGMFSILELDNSSGEYIDHYGEYLEIDRPGKLVFTLSVPKHFAGETRVTISIAPTKSGCDLTLIQTGVAKEVTEKNWQEMLGKLKSVLEKK